MNWTHVLRIAWKDYRRMGAFWVCLVVFWLVCLCYLTWTAFRTRNFVAPAPLEATVLFALVTGTIYALGWGAITFAAEHEDKTYGMLRSLPLNAKHVFYGKLVFGVSSTLLLLVTLAFMCFGHWLILKSQGGRYELGARVDHSLIDLQLFGLTLMSLMIPFAMVIGLFWSLKIKRPLLALAIAGGSVVILPWLSTAATAVFYQAEGLGGEMPALPTAITLVSATLAFFFIDRRAVTKWLPNHDSPFVAPQAEESLLVKQQNWPGFRRLLWLHRGQDWWMCVAFALVACVCWVASAARFELALTSLLVFLCGILGVFTFRADHHEKRFRLLAQLGVRPFSYWVSRLIRPGLTALFISFVAAAMSANENLFASFGIEHWRSSAFLFCGCFAVFSVAQLFSLALPSTVVAIAATVVVSSVVWMWLALATMIRVPLWIGAIPLLILPLLASYLRVPRWFLETGSWKQWAVPGVALVMLAVGVPFATAMYRVYEVPGSEVPAQLTEIREPTTAEQQGAEAYRKVLSRFPRVTDLEDGVPFEISELAADPLLRHWIGYDNGTVDQLVAATKQESVMPEEFRANVGWDRRISEIPAAILLNSARRAEEDQDVDKAWEYYVAALRFARNQNDGYSGLLGVARAQWIEASVYERLVVWAMHPANTAERVEAAAAFLIEYQRDQPPWQEALNGDYAQMMAWLDEPSELVPLLNSTDQPLAAIIQFAPWELERTRRLINYRFARDFAHLESQLTRRDGRTVQRLAHDERKRLAAIAKSTFIGQVAGAESSSWPTFAYSEHRRVGAVYQLAAIAHHRQHGEYPASFDGRSVGEHQLPDDFYSPGRKLQIDTDSHAASPILLTNHAKQLGIDTFSDGSEEDRHFLLPRFDDWSEDAFFKRKKESTRQARIDRAARAEEAANRAIANPYAPPESKLPLYTALLSQFGNEAIEEQIKRQMIGEMLTGDGPARLSLIRRLGVESVREFLPELTECLVDADPAVAGSAAEVIRSALRQVLARDLAPIEGASELVSVSSSQEEAQLVGVPILNHENGHYYEIIPFEEGVPPWHAALELASRRRFRNMEGHLVTITSQSEDEFLMRAFSGLRAGIDFGGDFLEAWAGATDSEVEGEWKWACGPELGTTFWRGDEALGYANWQDEYQFLGEAQKEREDFLLWRSHRGGEGESSALRMWIMDDDEAQGAYGDVDVIVEYSANEEPAD